MVISPRIPPQPPDLRSGERRDTCFATTPMAALVESDGISAIPSRRRDCALPALSRYCSLSSLELVGNRLACVQRRYFRGDGF